jgi:hypothetical protein
MLAMARIALISVSLVSGATPALEAQSQENPTSPPEQDQAATWQVYKYRMAGKVRLLLFWVGKDNVGGGTIAFNRRLSEDSTSRADAIEVLFGSNPARVPGKINRWGYGREKSEWRIEGDGQAPKLVSTTFEGFMRHSSEESLSEVRSNAAKEKEKSLFWFDAIRSDVSTFENSVVVHFFSQEKEFDYTNPAGVDCAYRQRLQAGPPDRQRRLGREEASYTAPHGFLTALRTLMEQASERLEQKSAGWSSYRPSLPYLYNAKAYRLAVEGLDQHRSFELAPANAKDKAPQFTNVIEAEFEVTNLKTKETHSFSIWYPASGPLKGVPLRIVDKPRWWLRIELALDPESAKSGGVPQPYGALPRCQTVTLQTH